MSIRFRILLGVLWLVSLIAVGTYASAQSQSDSDKPTVLVGDDLGFRIERWQGNKPVGTFVVKVKGTWVEAQFATRALPAR
jgi:hypothetical protein